MSKRCRVQKTLNQMYTYTSAGGFSMPTNLMLTFLYIQCQSPRDYVNQTIQQCMVEHETELS